MATFDKVNFRTGHITPECFGPGGQEKRIMPTPDSQNRRLALSDSILDLDEAQLDVAVRLGDLPDSALMARRVGQVRWVICASPAFLRQYGTPTTPSDLPNLPCIAYEGLQLWRDWSFVGPQGAVSVVIRPRYSVSTADAVIAAALDDVGIACVMSYKVAPSLRDGSLVALLEDWAPPAFPVQLVYSARQHHPLKLRAFLDFVAPRLQERLRANAEPLP